MPNNKIITIRCQSESEHRQIQGLIDKIKDSTGKRHSLNVIEALGAYLEKLRNKGNEGY